MADTSDDPRLGTVIAGYRIEERIGRGGMGVVYRAQHLNLQRRAAIKIIAPDLAESEGFRERFTREARIAAALQHPNIVTVYDAGEVDGLLYLAMQYIQGQDLAAILRADGRLRPYRAIDVCRQVGAALDAAHAMGLIHRDVKPANVLIEGRNAFLTDFGLTKRLEGTHAQLTRAGDVVGTIHYVAPEQIEGRRVSARSDVYSLGCLLYHCLSGQVPFALRDRRRRHLRAPLRGAAEAVRAAAGAARGARRGDGQGARQVARPALPELRRHDLGRARGDRRGRPAERDDPAAVERGHGLDAGDPRRGRGGAPPAGAAGRARRPHACGGAGGARRPRRRARGAGPGARRPRARGAARPRHPRLGRLRPAGVGRCASDALTRDAKVLLLVDDGEKASRDAAAAGADERLAAPFSPLQLQVKLRRLLGAEVIGG